MKSVSSTLGSAADRWIVILLMSYSLGVSGWLLANGVHVTMEDGYYYFKIAQNLAQSGVPTFDGVNLTNGYHPLWLLCLGLVYKIVKGQEAGLLAGTLLQALFMAFTSALVYLAARRMCSRLPACLAAMLWGLLTFRTGLSGLEFSLQALGICAVALGYLQWFGSEIPTGWSPYAILGGLMGLTFLVRLDAIGLAFVLGVFLVWRTIGRRPGTQGILCMAAYAFPLACLVAGYLVIEWTVFGHVLPVSGVLKREWSAYLLARDPRYLAGGWLAAKLAHLIWPLMNFKTTWYARPVALGIFGVGGMWALGLSGHPPGSLLIWFRRTLIPLSPFALYGAISYLGYTLVYHGGLSFSPWYFVAQPWLAALAAGLLAELFSRGWQRRCYSPGFLWRRYFPNILSVCLCGAVVAVTSASLLAWQHSERTNRSTALLYDAARWANDNLPEQAVIGSWNAGTIGYLSARRVVNLDGVVNSWDYYLNGRQDACRYWEDQHITHLLDVFQGDRVLTATPLYPAYARCADRLILIWSDDSYNPNWSLRAFRIQR